MASYKKYRAKKVTRGFIVFVPAIAGLLLFYLYPNNDTIVPAGAALVLVSLVLFFAKYGLSGRY